MLQPAVPLLPAKRSCCWKQAGDVAARALQYSVGLWSAGSGKRDKSKLH